MKQKNLTQLSQQYETALAKLLKQGPAASVQPAAKLGHTAFTLGLDTLDLARIHDQAMAALGLAGVENAFAKLARLFFAEANAPIVATQRAAQADKASLSRTQAALDRRTQELVASTLELQRGAARNKLLEQAVEKNGHQHRESLEESLQLQKRLRQLTHRVMKMQEEERKLLSHELQNEIAQTLLGINARLLALRHENRTGARSLEDEIATTRQLVASSARSVRQFARSLDTPSFPHDRKSYVAAPFPSANRSFPVIAMAASAGGLKALSIILAGLPPDLPAAIAIVMHVAPDHKSLLADILKCRTDLSVKQASTGDMLAPSHVFIAPPNHHLFVVPGGRLKLSSAHAEKIHFARPSAEPLFASVAQIYTKSAIAVVLTGGDGDGSFGVQAIKENGGMVIAQDRPTSENFSMPETSINTGDVDFILPLEEIAPMLVALVWAGNKSPAAKKAVVPAGPAKISDAVLVSRNQSCHA